MKDLLQEIVSDIYDICMDLFGMLCYGIGLIFTFTILCYFILLSIWAIVYLGNLLG